MERIKAAVIGSGLIAQARHIPALLEMKREVSLVAICDKNEELARKTASQFGISKAYGSTSEMFSKEKFDLIDICVPPSSARRCCGGVNPAWLPCDDGEANGT